MLAEVRVRLADRRQMPFDFMLHMAAKTKLVLLVREILNVDDNLAVSCCRRGMLASLDLRHENLIRKIHERVVLRRAVRQRRLRMSMPSRTCRHSSMASTGPLPPQ